MNAPTDTPPLTPHELTSVEAIVEICKIGYAEGTSDRQRLAILKAAKALAKTVKHRKDYARNLAARKADNGAFYTPDAILADPPFVTPAPAPLSPDVPPMTEPSAPAPDAAETKTETNE